jgi:RHS repeat-associated protein
VGLTQALSDGTNTYIYGNGRIAQAAGANTEYILGDALGSVRQLTDASGAITYAGAYDPYSVVTSTSGLSQSPYAFTGEYYGDSTQLLYLRARHYAPSTGRFLTRDTWMGEYNRPLSLNRWNYVGGNPVNVVDPSGHCYGGSFWDLFKAPFFGPCLPSGSSVPGTSTSVPPSTSTTLTQVSAPTLSALILATATACATPAPTSTSTPTSTPMPRDIATMPYPGSPAYDEGGAWRKTAQKYKEIRDWMMTHAPDDLDYSADPDGYGFRFKDEILLTIIYTVEFRSYRGTTVFGALLGALSNQYYDSTFCGGNCDSVKKQLIWLSNKQGIRGSQQTAAWITNWHPKDRQYGIDVKNGMYTGRTGWEWGNYLAGSPFDSYPQKYSHVTYLDRIDGAYAGIVVFTAEQNLDCRRINCLGW